ncbi:MAG: Sua5/YciO/YrdC/YwlC family protein, partial [Actinomycetota bacterium]|nr:Sua5/YciO/YrdC/YwlC family protein [Actinomycetota bacterium]
MARYFDVHPHDPQPRSIAQAADIIRRGGLIAYPTESGYALGCSLDNAEGKERITRIRA